MKVVPDTLPSWITSSTFDNRGWAPALATVLGAGGTRSRIAKTPFWWGGPKPTPYGWSLVPGVPSGVPLQAQVRPDSTTLPPFPQETWDIREVSCFSLKPSLCFLPSSTLCLLWFATGLQAWYDGPWGFGSEWLPFCPLQPVPLQLRYRKPLVLCV